MEELREMDDTRIGAKNINSIRYADDIVLITDSEDKLHNLAYKLQEESTRVGIKINFGKTEVMGVTKRREPLQANITVEGTVLKQVTSFNYLRILAAEDRTCDKEILARIGMAEENFGQPKSRQTDTNLSA